MNSRRPVRAVVPREPYGLRRWFQFHPGEEPRHAHALGVRPQASAAVCRHRHYHWGQSRQDVRLPQPQLVSSILQVNGNYSGGFPRWWCEMIWTSECHFKLFCLKYEKTRWRFSIVMRFNRYSAIYLIIFCHIKLFSMLPKFHQDVRYDL